MIFNTFENSVIPHNKDISNHISVVADFKFYF